MLRIPFTNLMAILMIFSLGCTPDSEEKKEEESQSTNASAEQKAAATEVESTDTNQESGGESSEPDENETTESNQSSGESQDVLQSASKAAIPREVNRPDKSKNSGSASKASEFKTAYSTATRLRSSAAASAKKGNMQTAYRTTLAAWEAVRHQKTDESCRKLAAALLKELAQYGEKLGEPVIGAKHTKPIRYE